MRRSWTFCGQRRSAAGITHASLACVQQPHVLHTRRTCVEACIVKNIRRRATLPTIDSAGDIRKGSPLPRNLICRMSRARYLGHLPSSPIFGGSRGRILAYVRNPRHPGLAGNICSSRAGPILARCVVPIIASRNYSCAYSASFMCIQTTADVTFTGVTYIYCMHEWRMEVKRV